SARCGISARSSPLAGLTTRSGGRDDCSIQSPSTKPPMRVSRGDSIMSHPRFAEVRRSCPVPAHYRNAAPGRSPTPRRDFMTIGRVLREVFADKGPGAGLIVAVPAVTDVELAAVLGAGGGIDALEP